MQRVSALVAAWYILLTSANAATLPTPGALQLPSGFTIDTDASVYTRYDLDTIDALAVCNDGTPAFYYFNGGVGTGSDKCEQYLSECGRSDKAVLMKTSAVLLLCCASSTALVRRWSPRFATVAEAFLEHISILNKNFTTGPLPK